MEDPEKRLLEIDQEYVEAGQDGLRRPYAEPLTGKEKELGEQLFRFVFGGEDENA